MYSMSKDDLIKALTSGAGGMEQLRLDIPADWDPEAIRDSTTIKDVFANDVLRIINVWIIPILLVAGILAQLAGWPMTERFMMAGLSGLFMISGLGALADRFYMSRNESLGNYENLAVFIFRSGSNFWKYQNFDDDVAVSFKPVFYLVGLAVGTIALGWWLALGILTLAAIAKIYTIIMMDSKGNALLRYKQHWETQQEADLRDADLIREAQARAAREIEAIEQGLVRNPAFGQKEGEPEYIDPRANAMTEDGPVYEPVHPYSDKDNFPKDDS